MWKNLREDVEEMFSGLSVPVFTSDADGDAGEGAQWDGFHVDPDIRWIRLTTQEQLTEDQVKAKRAVLERRRYPSKLTGVPKGKRVNALLKAEALALLASGISQAEASRILGVHRVTVSAWKRSA